MKKKLIVLSSVLALAPALAFAAPAACSAAVSGTIPAIICTIGNILNSIIPVLVILGIIYFVWGVITYVIASDEEAKKSGRNRIIYGIIGLAAIVAMWGLVNILITTFGLNSNTNVTLPTIVIP